MRVGTLWPHGLTVFMPWLGEFQGCGFKVWGTAPGPMMALAEPQSVARVACAAACFMSRTRAGATPAQYKNAEALNPNPKFTIQAPEAPAQARARTR